MKYEKPVVKIIDVKEDIVTASNPYGSCNNKSNYWNDAIGYNCTSAAFKAARRD